MAVSATARTGFAEDATSNRARHRDRSDDAIVVATAALEGGSAPCLPHGLLFGVLPSTVY